MINDINDSSLYQKQRRFQGVSQEKRRKSNAIYCINLFAIPLSSLLRTGQLEKRTELHRDQRTYIYIYIYIYKIYISTHNCIAEEYTAGGRCPPPRRASLVKRMHFGCSCEFVRASNARMHEYELFMRCDVGGGQSSGVESETARTTRYNKCARVCVFRRKRAYAYQRAMNMHTLIRGANWIICKTRRPGPRGPRPFCIPLPARTRSPACALLVGTACLHRPTQDETAEWYPLPLPLLWPYQLSWKLRYAADSSPKMRFGTRPAVARNVVAAILRLVNHSGKHTGRKRR